MVDWKLLALIILILLVLFYLLSPAPPSSAYHALEERFNNTSSNLDHLGGLLVANFSLENFQAMMQRGDVALIDTAACASTNRKTCTAYSLVRRDLVPMLFLPPGIIFNVSCGLILDVQKAWSLITLTSIVDGDTDLRSCCTNETGEPLLIRSPFRSWDQDKCALDTLIGKYGSDSPWVKGNYAVYTPLLDKGGGYPTSCNGDLDCMYANSGGTINLWRLLQSQQCQSGDYKDCWDFELAVPAQVPELVKNDPSLISKDGTPLDGYLIMTALPDCSICKKPYLCVPEDAPSGDKYQIVEEPDRVATYIGKDGLGFQETISYHLDVGYVNVNQCRFEKKDWNLWIRVLKGWYQEWLGIQAPDNSLPQAYNYMLSNPRNPSYLENEIDLYLDPDPNSAEYQRQNEVWQDAIIGFYYIDTTCEEQLSPLNGITTTQGPFTYANSVDRCDAFWKLDDPTMDTDARRQWEINNLAASREVVRRVAEMFNDRHKKNIPVYRCSANSSTFPNYSSMEKALKGETKLRELFVPDA